MKSKSLILLVLSIGFGVVAAIGISQVMNGRVNAETTATPMGSVLVATGPLDLKARLTEENVKIESWPAAIIPPDAVSNMEEIIDMVTLSRMSQGMPIVRGAIQHKNTAARIPIPENMKVFAIRVSADQTVGNLLNPGDKVDVIGVFKKRDAKSRQTITTSTTFLKALQVYSIGNKTTIDPTKQSKNPSAVSIVGLLVTEKQSEALVFVQDTGSIKLVLRGDDVENTGEVGPLEEIKSELLAAEEEFAPSPGVKTVMDIWLGNESSTTEFGRDGSRVRNVNVGPRGGDASEGSGKREPGTSEGSGKREPGGSGGKYSDQDEFSDRGDSNRGIGDDQYPGE